MIHYKDHYRTLEIEPSANITEIRKAYRRLAHQYHPDKNAGDPYATAQFAAIKEAYEILTHPARKEIYLQQRWYNQSMGRKRAADVLTPDALLKQMLELERYVSRLDVHRMDKAGLYEYLQGILSESNIATVNAFRENVVNKEVVRLSLQVSKVLLPEQQAKLAIKWGKLTDDAELAAMISHRLQHARRAKNWQRIRPFVLLLFVFVICLIMLLLTD